MSTFCLVNVVIIISICFEFVYFLLFYFLVRLDIRILINAKNIDKKYNFNKNVILANINKTVESGRKTKKTGRRLLLIGTIFTIVYFILRVPCIIRFGEKIIFTGRDRMMAFDELMIFGFISALWAAYFFNLIHKRNIVAREQFIRLFKEENSSSNT
jgi:hypothetical protein